MAEDKQYSSGSIVDIDRLTKLKEKVKAECLRRKYTGSFGICIFILLNPFLTMVF